jgi:hypothetical protein
MSNEVPLAVDVVHENDVKSRSATAVACGVVTRTVASTAPSVSTHWLRCTSLILMVVVALVVMGRSPLFAPA